MKSVGFRLRKYQKSFLSRKYKKSFQSRFFKGKFLMVELGKCRVSLTEIFCLFSDTFLISELESSIS